MTAASGVTLNDLRKLVATVYKVSACLPLSWLLLLATFLLRARLADPHYNFNIDPDYLGMSIHRFLTSACWLLAVLSFPVTVLLTGLLLLLKQWRTLALYTPVFLVGLLGNAYLEYSSAHRLLVWFMD